MPESNQNPQPTSQKTTGFSGNRRTVTSIAAIIALAASALGGFEGRVLTAYPDILKGWSLPTICEGHTGPDVYKGLTLTPAQCDDLKSADLYSHYKTLDRCMPMKMTQSQLAAMLLLSINIGPTALCKSSIPNKFKQGRYADACATITEFHFANGLDCTKPASNCRGIPIRRQAERTLCESPSPIAM